ncbi:MAG: AGE family epimerase/isomerase [Acidobacteriota bacterium]|nr:AGE family epimerase/isomerase [Acidobacteriota bacterium]
MDSLREFYRKLLTDGIVPFWMKALDREYGGVFSCMTEEGTVVSTEKYTWSQARLVWTLSAIYHRIERRQEFLDHARKTLDFLLGRARDEQGRFVYRTTREGAPIEGATSIYSDCFVVYGIREYCRAAPDAGLSREADAILDRVKRRVEEPDFRETAPYALPAGRRAHAIPMILTAVSGEDRYPLCVMERFVQPVDGLVREFLTRDYGNLPGAEGRFVNPGHAIESMWFVMEWARARGRDWIIEMAAETVRRHLEAGWDREFGGIFLGIDAAGGAPFLPHSEKKMWWPHTEALYALLLADRLTGEAWCREWYWRVHEWAFAHFAMPETGEWRQRLDREGRPITDVVALPVKDPFHLPRAAVKIVELIEEGEDDAWRVQRAGLTPGAEFSP